MWKILPVLFLFLLRAAAQEMPRVDVFGGYSLLHANEISNSASFNASGWNAAVTPNFNRWLGLTFDVSGQYASFNRNRHALLAGPKLSLPIRRATPFLHVLAGGMRSSDSGRSATQFAWAVGGGTDVNVTDRLAVRLVQADFLQNTERKKAAVCPAIIPPPPACIVTGSTTRNNARLSFGVVFKLGAK